MIPRLASERRKPFSSSRARASTSGPAPCTFEARTSSSTAAARNAASISSSTASRMRPSTSARHSAIVSNSVGGAREVVVDLGQHLLVDVLDRDRRPSTRSRRRARSAPRGCRPTLAPTSAVSTSSTSRPLPSSTTVSDCVCPSPSTRSMTSVSPSRAGRSSAGTSSATLWRSASSSCSTSSSGTTDSARGTSSVVQSTISGVGCTSTVAWNVHGSSCVLGSSNSYSGAVIGRSRVRAAALQNQPPMCDSTASAQSRSLPTWATSTGVGTFPLRNPGTRTDSERSCVACSTAWWSSCGDTSTVRRTRFPPSSSTWATAPFKQRGGG